MTGHASDRRPTSPGAAGPSRSLGAQRLTSTEPAPAAAVDETVVTLEGDLDLTAAERLRPLFQDAVAPRRRLVLDLSSVTHVSATALAVLVRATGTCVTQEEHSSCARPATSSSVSCASAACTA